MKLETIIGKLRQQQKAYQPPPLGTRELLAHWVIDEDHEGDRIGGGSLIDLVGYGKLLEVLPDKVVQNLERARLAREGRIPMLKAGLGYVELLAPVVVDGTQITSSSTENILFPDLKIPGNYLQPGNLTGRTLRWRARGRMTTLTTAATLTFNIGSGTTAVTVPTVSWAKSGTITMDTTAQTASQWFCEGDVTVRSVGTAGTVFAQGYALPAGQAVTVANQHADFMGSAGQDTPSTGSFDMTVDQYLAITAKWSLSTAYAITGHVYTVEALN